MILFVKNLLFTIFVPGTIAVLLPYLLSKNETPAPGISRILALCFFVIGGLIYAWCLWDFATFGRGTPAPIDAPKKLVVRGLYRYSRNPMYLGVLTVITGWALFFLSANVLLYALIMTVSFNLFVRFYEEPHLRNLFGSEYDEYSKRVDRWFSIQRKN